MNLEILAEWLIAALLVIGAFFSLVGSIGLARLPDFFMRLHAPTKASTLGLGGILIASMIYAAVQGRAGFAELLITLFIFVTAPVSANLMAQAALHLRLPSKAPLPGNVARSPTATATKSAKARPRKR
ncbi:Na+/H+ antiporter subunit G [Caldimonas tepidiphila]|uniref:Na+/H+ antiporter subunit G n=1 Tax=Caldimonas tepidiphila TaxID=2315841 RepID=UPI000E5B4B72|nr:Na+/H+ antiporter subunit G [Caldimonas tepidiphila]